MIRCIVEVDYFMNCSTLQYLQGINQCTYYHHQHTPGDLWRATQLYWQCCRQLNVHYVTMSNYGFAIQDCTASHRQP